MPPYALAGGGGGHGGHHHGGGGHGWHGGGGGGWGWGPQVIYANPYPDFIETVAPSDDQHARALAYVMSLPVDQRAAAYQRLFGMVAPAGVLGSYEPSTTGWLVIGAVAAYFLLRKAGR